MDEPATRNGVDEGEGGLESAVESPTKRHFTRSSIKPRLLFPTAHSDESQELDEEEEAVTDIEDHVLAGLEAGKDKVRTPTEMIFDEPSTPSAPRFAPASPPATTRTTRKKASSEPTSKGKQPAAKRSPFDSWRRVKGPGEAGTTAQKRSGDELPAAAPKRSRA